MFKTVRNAKLLPALNTCYSDAQFWAYVELEIALPWFYAVKIEENQLERHRSYLLVPTVPSLQQIIDEVLPGTWLEAVYAVTPDDLNNSGVWRMELLSELAEFKNSNGSVIGYEFVVISNVRYSTVLPDVNDSNITKRIIFSA